MKTMTATEAKTHFGKLLDDVRDGPVSIEKNGRSVAIISSHEDYEAHQGGEVTATDDHHHMVMEAHKRSMKKWGKVYEALAK